MSKFENIKVEEAIAAYDPQSRAEKMLDKIEAIIISDFKDGMAGRTTLYKIVEVLGEE